MNAFFFSLLTFPVSKKEKKNTNGQDHAMGEAERDSQQLCQLDKHQSVHSKHSCSPSHFMHWFFMHDSPIFRVRIFGGRERGFNEKYRLKNKEAIFEEKLIFSQMFSYRTNQITILWPEEVRKNNNPSVQARF